MTIEKKLIYGWLGIGIIASVGFNARAHAELQQPGLEQETQSIDALDNALTKTFEGDPIYEKQYSHPSDNHLTMPSQKAVVFSHESKAIQLKASSAKE